MIRHSASLGAATTRRRTAGCPAWHSAAWLRCQARRRSSVPHEPVPPEPGDVARESVWSAPFGQCGSAEGWTPDRRGAWPTRRPRTFDPQRPAMPGDRRWPITGRCPAREQDRRDRRHGLARDRSSRSASAWTVSTAQATHQFGRSQPQRRRSPRINPLGSSQRERGLPPRPLGRSQPPRTRPPPINPPGRSQLLRRRPPPIMCPPRRRSRSGRRSFRPRGRAPPWPARASGPRLCSLARRSRPRKPGRKVRLVATPTGQTRSGEPSRTPGPPCLQPCTRRGRPTQST
jgi:hypothetical protein